MSGFFDNLTELFAGKKKDQGADTAPSLLSSLASIGDAVVTGWQKFVADANENAKRKIQSGQYTMAETSSQSGQAAQKPTIIDLNRKRRSPTAQIKQTQKQTKPWELDNPFGEQSLDDRYHRTVYELYDANREQRNRNPFEDAYKMTYRYANDIFQSYGLNKDIDKTRNPFDIAEKTWDKDLDYMKGVYAAEGKSGAEQAKMLEEGGRISPKTHQQRQEQSVIDTAQKLQNADDPYFALRQIGNDVKTSGQVSREQMGQAWENLQKVLDKNNPQDMATLQYYSQRLGNAKTLTDLGDWAAGKYDERTKAGDENWKRLNAQAGAYERLADTLGSVRDNGGMAYGLTDPNDAALYQQMMASPKGKAIINRYLSGQATDADIKKYGQTMADALRNSWQPKQMTYEQADKYLDEQMPMYNLAKDTQGQMDDYTKAYKDIQGIGQRAARGETLTDTEKQAWSEATMEMPWLSDWRFGLDEQGNSRDEQLAMTQEQQRQLQTFGETRARQIADVSGLYSPYAMSDYNRGVWEQYVKTPEGAEQWYQESVGTDDEQPAWDNRWFVNHRAKYDEIANRPDYQELVNAYQGMQVLTSEQIARGMKSEWSAGDSNKELTPEEDDMFKAVTVLEGEKGAQEYLKYMQYETDKRYRDKIAQEAYNLGSDGFWGGVGGTVAHLAANLGGGLGFLDFAGQYVKNMLSGENDRQPINTNTFAYIPSTIADSSMQGVMDQVDWVVPVFGENIDLFDKIYGIGVNVLDNLNAAAIGELAGGLVTGLGVGEKAAATAGKWTASALLATSAAQSGMAEVEKAGGNNTQKLLTGLAYGLNEGLWESLSISRLMKESKAIGRDGIAEQVLVVLKSMGTNFSEEFNTTVANQVANLLIMKEKGELNQEKLENIRLGLSPDEAKDKKWSKFFMNALNDGIDGAIEGGIFGVVENAQSTHATKQVDKAVGSGFSAQALDTLYSLAEGENASQKVKELAKKHPKEKANAKQVGQLFRAVMETAGDNVRESLKNVAVADIALQIGRQTGAVDTRAADAVADMMAGKTLSGVQVAAIAQNKAALQVVNELFKPEAEAKGDAASPHQSPAATASPQGEALNSALEPVQFEPMPGMELPEPVAPHQSPAATASPARGSLLEAPKISVKTVIGQDKSAAAQRIESIDEDEGGGVRVKLEDGQTVDLEDAGLSAPMQEVARIAAGQDQAKAAALMNAAQEVLGKGITSSVTPDGATPSEGYRPASAENHPLDDFPGASAPLEGKAFGETDEASARLAADVAAGRDFALGFSAVYDAAAKGQTREQVRTIYGEQLQEDVRQKAYEAGRQAFERLEEQARQRNMEEAKAFGFRTVEEAVNGGVTSSAPSGGTFPSEGKAFGVLFDRVGDSLRDKDGNVDNGKLLALRLIDRVYKQTGMQARVVDKLENDANGKYVHGTNIVYLSLDAEEGAITKAASHEGFHFISAFSPDMKKTITDFVLDRLGRVEGYDLEQRIKEVRQQYRDGAGQELEQGEDRYHDGAIEEIVADSMLDVIGTEENMAALMKESKSTAEKIKEWITNTYQKFKEILNRLAGDSPETAALKDDVDYLGKISEMWKEGTRQAAEAWQQAQVGYNDGSAALEQNQAVQQYRQEMQGDMTVEDRESSLTAFLTNLFGDTQKEWIQQHMDQWEEGLGKFRQALLEYKRGGVALNVALERQGLAPLAGNDIRVASYAAEQALTLEGAKERANNRQTEGAVPNHKYSLMPFSKQVDEMKKGNIPETDSLFVCNTPQVFLDIGFSMRPMALDQYHAKAAITGSKPNHYIPENVFKTLPEQLGKPIAIIESASRPDDSVVVIFDKTLKTGQWMAAIEIQGIRNLNGKEYKVIPINNTQGRKNTITKLLKDALQNEIDNGHGVYYINEKRARELGEPAGVQFPSYLPQNGLIHKITDSGSSVKDKLSLPSKRKDAEYMAAVESGDEERARRLVDEAAKAAGYDAMGYHGSRNFGFNRFDLGMGQGTIFVSFDDPVLAQTYTKSAEVRSLAEQSKSLEDMTGMELYTWAEEHLKTVKGSNGKNLRARVFYDDDAGTFTLVTEPERYGEARKRQTLTRDGIIDLLGGLYDKRKNEGVYQLYTKSGNQLVIDAKGDSWRDITVPWDDSGKTYKTREIAEYARNNGYDSVRINNVYDGGGISARSGEDGFGDIGIFFNAEDVKSADVVTRDDQGHVIPLSERFDTGKEDVRYSLPTQPRQQADAAEAVRQDAELYAQMRQDADSRAALELLTRMHQQTTEGGENALIKPGAFEKRLSEMVERIKEDTATRMSDRAIRKGLRTVYQAMEKPGYSVGEILTYAREFNQQVLEQAPGVLVEMDDSTREAVRILRTNPFQLTPDQKSEIKGTYGSLGDFMRKNFGKLKIRNGAKVTLADVWRESLNPLNPGLFAEDTAEADMPGIIDAFLENAHAKKFAGEFGANIGAMSTDGALNLMLDFYDVPGALKQKSEIREEYQGKYNKLEREMVSLRATAREAVNNAKWMYEQRYRERIERDRQTKAERAAKEAVVKNIAKNTKYLYTRSMKGTDARHVPEELRGAIERLMQSMQGQRAVFSGQEAREFAIKYAKLAQDGQLHDIDLAARYDKDIQAILEHLAEQVTTQRLTDMTMEQLQDVDNVVSHLRSLVDEQNDIQANGRKETVRTWAEDVIRQAKGMKEANRNPVAEAARKLKYKEITPVYFARQVGGPLGELIMEMVKGESDYAHIMANAKNKLDGLIDEHKVNNWLHDPQHKRMKTTAGDEIELTREQAMTLYAWWEREKRNTVQGAEHLRRGGFVYDTADADVKKMKGVNFTKSHVLSDADMRQIGDWLTEEQRKFVADMVGYLSKDMAEIGNKTSMALYGWKKYGEKWYFPYPTDSNFRGQDSSDQKSTGQRQLKNLSHSHALTEHAMNPLRLENFTDLWKNHVKEMAMYGALAEKVDNLRRVTNYVVGGVENIDLETGTGEVIAPVSVKKELERTLGREGVRYLEQLIDDVNGGLLTDERAGIDKMISLFKKGSVAANLSVMLQQPSAFVRAMSMVSPRYFASGLKEHGGYKATKERMYANSGTAILKQAGGFDTGTGKGVDWLTENIKPANRADRIREGIDKWTGKGAELADEITWVYMYSAIEHEIADKTGMDWGSKEFNQAVADRFDEVMRYTQVYDSIMAKSGAMRGKGNMDKMLTSFLAEPTLWMNMLMDAAQDVIDKKPGARKKAAGAVGVFVMGSFVNALLQSVATAFRRKKEEGTTWAEKYLSEVADNFTDSIGLEGIAGMIPIGRDIVSIAQGYDVERTDMSVISDLWNAFIKVKDKGFVNASADDWLNLAGMAGNAFGIPVRNMIRDVSGIIGNMFGGWSAPLSETSWRDILYTTLDTATPFATFEIWAGDNKSYYDRMEQALIKGDMDKYNELRGYLEDTKKVKGDTITSELRKQLKESVLRGLVTEEKAVDIMVNQLGVKNEKEAYTSIEEYIGKAEFQGNKEEYKYEQYGDLYSAVQKGQGVEDEIKRLEERGYDRKSVADAIKSKAKEQYLAGGMTRAQTEKTLGTYVGLSNDDNYNLYWTMEEWDWLKEHPGKNGENYKKEYGVYGDVIEAVYSENAQKIKAAVQKHLEHPHAKEIKTAVHRAITDEFKDVYVELWKGGKKTEAANLKAAILTAYEAAGYPRDMKNKDMDKWVK